MKWKKTVAVKRGIWPGISGAFPAISRGGAIPKPLYWLEPQRSPLAKAPYKPAIFPIPRRRTS